MFTLAPSDCLLSYPPTLMMPSDWQDKKVNLYNNRQPVSREDLLSVPNQLIGSFDLSTEGFCEALYEHSLFKILSHAEVNVKRGKIINSREKNIQLYPDTFNLDHLKGTEEFYDKQQTETSFSYVNNGHISLMISLKLDKGSKKNRKISLLC